MATRCRSLRSLFFSALKGLTNFSLQPSAPWLSRDKSFRILRFSAAKNGVGPSGLLPTTLSCTATTF